MPEILIAEGTADGVKWSDRALIWIEYLVLMEAYDRSLPGDWAEQVEGDRIWLVHRGSLQESIAHAQHHHRRAILALRTLLGEAPKINEEATIMSAILDNLQTHEARVAVLDDRSPATEFLGPSMFVSPRRPD